MDREIRQLERQIESLSEPDNLPFISRLNVLRLRRGEVFPAIKIGDFWLEVVNVEKIFESRMWHLYPSAEMGLLQIQNGRQFYFFRDSDGLDSLLKDDEKLSDEIHGNYGLFDIPTQNGVYRSEYFVDVGYVDEPVGYVDEPGWYFTVAEDNLDGPYNTEEEVIRAYNQALEDLYPDGFKMKDRQHIFNAETAHIYFSHPGIYLEEDGDYNQAFEDLVNSSFSRPIYSFWIVPAIFPPFGEEAPEWIWWYGPQK